MIEALQLGPCSAGLVLDGRQAGRQAGAITHLLAALLCSAPQEASETYLKDILGFETKPLVSVCVCVCGLQSLGALAGEALACASFARRLPCLPPAWRTQLPAAAKVQEAPAPAC